MHEYLLTKLCMNIQFRKLCSNDKIFCKFDVCKILFCGKLPKIVHFFRKKYLKFYLDDFWKKYLSIQVFVRFQKLLKYCSSTEKST